MLSLKTTVRVGFLSADLSTSGVLKFNKKMSFQKESRTSCEICLPSFQEPKFSVGGRHVRCHSCQSTRIIIFLFFSLRRKMELLWGLPLPCPRNMLSCSPPKVEKLLSPFSKRQLCRIESGFPLLLLEASLSTSPIFPLNFFRLFFFGMQLDANFQTVSEPPCSGTLSFLPHDVVEINRASPVFLIKRVELHLSVFSVTDLGSPFAFSPSGGGWPIRLPAADKEINHLKCGK